MNTGQGQGTETTETIELFVEQTQITFPVLLDVGNTLDQLGWPPAISPYPRQALLGGDGTIVYMDTEHDDAALRAAIEGALPE